MPIFLTLKVILATGFLCGYFSLFLAIFTSAPARATPAESVSAYAQKNPSSWLSHSLVIPKPNQQVHNSWVENVFDSDEDNLEVNRTHLSIMLPELALDPNTHVELSNVIANTNHHKVVIPEAIKNTLDISRTRALYFHLYRIGDHPLSLYEKTFEALEKQILSWNLSEDFKQRTLHLIFPVGTEYALPLSPKLWKAMPISSRKRYIANHILKPGVHNIGLNITLQIPEAILERYQQGHISTLQELIETIDQSPELATARSHYLDIASLMPQNTQDSLHRFDERSGLNCFACSLNYHRDETINGFINSADLEDVLADEFVKLEPVNRPLAEDLIVYRDHHEQIIHTAIQILPQYLHSKNGAQKFTPPVNQHREIIDFIYLKHGGSIDYYRPKHSPLIGRLQVARQAGNRCGTQLTRTGR